MSGLPFLFPVTRIRLIVEVNLDPVPGWGNTAEDYRALTHRLLSESIGHYKPTVTIDGDYRSADADPRAGRRHGQSGVRCRISDCPVCEKP